MAFTLDDDEDFMPPAPASAPAAPPPAAVPSPASAPPPPPKQPQPTPMPPQPPVQPPGPAPSTVRPPVPAAASPAALVPAPAQRPAQAPVVGTGAPLAAAPGQVAPKAPAGLRPANSATAAPTPPALAVASSAASASATSPAGGVLSPMTSSGLSFRLPDPPTAHVDADLGVGSLTAAVTAIAQNQQTIEQTEAQLQALLRHHARLAAASRLLEQQKVLDVLAAAPTCLGYDAGRPAAAIIVFRCCLRWGAFSGDAHAAAVLDQLSALLMHATDEDGINARHTAAAAKRSAGREAEADAEADAASVSAAATREVAYWLAVISCLLALVEPYLPLAAAPGAAGSAGRNGGGGAATVHAVTPLAAVAVDARASMARAASVAAAKVHELQKRMELGFKGFLMRRKSTAPAETALAAAGGQQQQQQQEQQQQQPAEQGIGAEGQVAHVAAPDAAHLEASQAPDAAPAPAAPPAPVPAAPPAAPAGPPIQPGQPFRQHLDLMMQKTYNALRDSLKRHVSAVLPACVQQQALLSPQLSGGCAEERYIGLSLARESMAGVPVAGIEAGGVAADGVPTSPYAVPAAALEPWRELVGVLAEHLALLRATHVPRILIRCLYKQTLAFINVQLFNQLLLRPDCCCTSNARYLVAGLQLLEDWLAAPTTPGSEALEGPAGGHEELSVLADDLRHIRQASHFLVLANKGALRLDDITAMCPALNMQQLYRLATTFWDDSPLPPPPPPPRSHQSTDLSRATSGGGPALHSAEAAAAEEAPSAPASGLEAEGEAGKDESSMAGEVAEDGKGEAEAAREGPDAHAAAAAAAVAAAEAAAAADEAADARAAAPATHNPPQDPVSVAAAAAAAAVVSRNVSGEVLEEMKRRHAGGLNNGGLIVTFLLDEDSSALIAPGGAIARKLLTIINEPRLHQGLSEGLPAALRGEDVPPQVFAYLTGPEAAVLGGPASDAGDMARASIGSQ
ncbi:hypothetical protein HYH02_012684 [Chlamydomonas schloesseri]|uniref:Dilute domain-containing protein n=1 Tax=Chlamydomonas schloesseri TaxID=2026947 RepID=A0A835SUH6_9CHLO|nr:hypothetical protein HYH02_012684 [Chlamydomonas schloesseri]|eukprot:KAG2433567.1 hypothetical protein HYH02_012684 [Chlamydomonas schloesseri]